jgi:hypothetical protein
VKPELVAQADAVDLLQDVLELVRDELDVVLCKIQADFRAKRAGFVPVDDGLRTRARVEHVGHVDLHAQHRDGGNPLALAAERGRTMQQIDQFGLEHPGVDVPGQRALADRRGGHLANGGQRSGHHDQTCNGGESTTHATLPASRLAWRPPSARYIVRIPCMLRARRFATTGRIRTLCARPMRAISHFYF